MKEAYGGIFNIIFVSIFLVIMIGVLGLTVGYTKAFKMKSSIIAIIEEYEGSPGCFNTGAIGGNACLTKIKKRAQDLAYNPVSSSWCPSDYKQVENFYCVKISSRREDEEKGKKYAIFSVITRVNMPFPIVAKIMGFDFFQTGGETKEIQIQLKNYPL